MKLLIFFCCTMLTLAAAYPNMPEFMAEDTPPTPEKPTGDRSDTILYTV